MVRAEQQKLWLRVWRQTIDHRSKVQMSNYNQSRLNIKTFVIAPFIRSLLSQRCQQHSITHTTKVKRIQLRKYSIKIKKTKADLDSWAWGIIQSSGAAWTVSSLPNFRHEKNSIRTCLPWICPLSLLRNIQLQIFQPLQHQQGERKDKETWKRKSDCVHNILAGHSQLPDSLKLHIHIHDRLGVFKPLLK